MALSREKSPTEQIRLCSSQQSRLLLWYQRQIEIPTQADACCIANEKKGLKLNLQWLVHHSAIWDILSSPLILPSDYFCSHLQLILNHIARLLRGGWMPLWLCISSAPGAGTAGANTVIHTHIYACIYIYIHTQIWKRFLNRRALSSPAKLLFKARIAKICKIKRSHAHQKSLHFSFSHAYSVTRRRIYTKL